MQVAVDGPAGSGKSSVCKIVAEKYGLTYIDTGAMYRSVAWLSLNFDNIDLVEEVKKLEFILEDNGKKISISYLGKTYNLTDEIRIPSISSKVSEVASNSDIRNILVAKQQAFAKNTNVIMEGRDITTVVLPNADLKIFLTASLKERALRRFNELQEKNISVNFDEILADITKRDEMDINRSSSPLIQSEDAIFLDTTNLTLEEVADNIGKMIIDKQKSQ